LNQTTTVTFADEAGRPAALVLSGFVHHNYFYGRAKTVQGWKEVRMPLSVYVELLSQ